MIAFSKSFCTHLKDVDIALSTLRKKEVSLNLKKCCLFTDIEKFLRHIIEHEALANHEAHSESLINLKHPRNVTKL